MNLPITIIHSACGNLVSLDPADISVGDTELLEPGETSGYYAACLSCDEDLYQFETGNVAELKSQTIGENNVSSRR